MPSARVTRVLSTPASRHSRRATASAPAILATTLLCSTTVLAQTAPGVDANKSLSPVTVKAAREVIDEAPAPYAGGQVGTGARLGILGNTSVMDTPFSITGYTAETIRNEQAHSVADLISVEPSVRMSSARSNINENITIRGFDVPTADFALNGMFGLLPYWRAPLEAVERVEILKGPSAALYGVTPSGSIGGVVNLVPKRAGNEAVTSLTGSFMSDSVFGAHVDIGRRFGTDNAFGVRLNAVRRQGDTAINAQSSRDTMGALALDFRQRSVRASLDLIWQEQRIDNVVRQFQLGPTLTAIPRVPDNATAYPGFGYTDGRDGSALFKAEYDVTESTTAFVGLGQRKNNWSAIAANPVILNTAGDYSFFGGFQRQSVTSKTAEVGIRQAFATGPITHKASLVYTSLKQEQTLGFYTNYPGGASNLYTNQLFPNYAIDGVSNPLRLYLDTKLSSIALADTMSFLQDKVLLTLGVRHQTVEAQNYNFATGVPSGAYYDQSANTPLAGIVFKLSPMTSLYASYVEGLSRGDTAPVTATITNPGLMLAPYKSKQKEIGAKFDFGRIMATVALFELSKPSASVSGTTFGINGEQRNRGVETSVAGEVSKSVRLLGGATYIDGELSKSPTAGLVGKQAIGVSKWQANLGAEWDASFLPGFTMTGRVVYTDKTYANATNTLQIPSWTRFDAGARYAVKLASKPVTFRLNVENLFNKDYYGVATAGYLHLGTPRTVSFSASVDL